MGTDDMIIIPLACSFPFGFIIYNTFIDTERLQREGKGIIFTKDGLLHLGLSFGTMIIGAIIMGI